MPSTVPITSDTVTSLPARDGDAATAAPVDRRAMILNEARLLFLERGYAAISMQQIADAAGINKATLYHHFRDKDDLFLAMLAREMADTRHRIEAAVALGGSLRQVLGRLAAATLDPARCDVRSLFASLKTEVAPERRAAFFSQHELPWYQLRPVFARAMASGEIKPGDPDLCVEVFFAMMASQMASNSRIRPALDPLVVAPYLVGLFIDGAARQSMPASDASEPASAT